MTDDKGTIIVPIVNLECTEDCIKLDETLCIRRTSIDELEELTKKALNYQMILDYILHGTNFVIEKKVASEKRLTASQQFGYWREDSKNIQNIALSLKLLQKGSINFPTAFFTSPNSHYVSETTPEFSASYEPYKLRKKDIANLIKIWKRTQTIEKEKPYLEFAFSQFNRSFEEKIAEMVNVDYMTAFESIIFHRVTDVRQPYGTTIGIGIGMLIGKNGKERADIVRYLSDAYTRRNNFVHGHLRHRQIENGVKNEVNENQKLDIIEDYLRRALRKLLEE